ncbi:DNA-binding bromodomain-containing protein [Artemisia annua]|uniref:DNA-binding bromodomain-containing protein n=1 Tax=Artemisia annua TaxID=35608 RepID=A0A2U1PHQ4_ARTAN|nr:DNA-binding bromodomain-containing protein [Artemisia annua]
MERMPDKKTLEFILDKLQKKDIYGVYARPVDPEELPDYYDVIKRPMDFATVRRKLAKGSYLTLKEFESDVLLICSNAMQYNAPDTIYYKQASSIQEQAKLRFQRLRTNVDRSEIEPKSEQRTVPSFSLPKKQLKKTEEFPNGSPAETPVRHNSPARENSGEMPVNESSSLGDNNLDKDQELLPVPTPKVDLEGAQGKGVMPKLGRKPSINEEDRRATYNISVQPATDSDSVLSTFEGESKQFIPVGLHADLAYARSLARFAATLGSVAWKVASQTIEQALPEGVKYGRGWVGEYEPLPTIPENRILKVPNFLALFNVPSDVEDSEKGSRFTAPNNHKATKIPVDGKEINGGFNPGISVRRESPREASKNLTPGPPFLSSFHANPSFSGSNVLHQNSTQMELNRPPPTHVSAADFVAKRPVSSPSDILSLRPSKPVGNLASLPSFNHPNSNKGNPTAVGLDSNRMAPTINSFPYGQEVRPVAVNQTTVGLDSNRMAPRINSFPYRQEVGPLAVNPTTVGLDSNRMAPTTNGLPYRQDVRPVNPTAVGLDSNRMAPATNGLPYRQEVRPVAVNPNTVGLDSNRMAPAINNFPYRQEVRPVAVNRDGIKKVQMDNNMTRQQEQQHGLSDPVQMMKMLAEKAQHQQQQNNSNDFGFGSNRDDSSNVALTAAQAWMSLGGTGGFLKPPQTENPNPHKQISSDYNMARDRQQPQVSRFRGEFPVPGVHYQQPVHGFVPQPVRTVNEAQAQVHLQNRNNVGFPQLMTTDLSRFQAQSNWRGVPPQMQLQSRPKQQDSRPPDLNIGYQSLGSPVKQSTGMMVDSQQPDLALQL